MPRNRLVEARPPKWASSQTITSSPLEAHIKDARCRVCDREIKPGDHCLSRAWVIGFACVTCGYYRVDDFVDADGAAIGKLGAAFIASCRRDRAIDQWEISALKTAQVIFRDEKYRLRWTETGKTLRAKYLEKFPAPVAT